MGKRTPYMKTSYINLEAKIIQGEVWFKKMLIGQIRKILNWFFDLVTWRTLRILIRLDPMKGQEWTSEEEEVKTGNIDKFLKNYFVKQKNK